MGFVQSGLEVIEKTHCGYHEQQFEPIRTKWEVLTDPENAFDSPIDGMREHFWGWIEAKRDFEWFCEPTASDPDCE